MPIVDVYTGYTAREAFEPFHARTEREAVLVCHRRAGKTVAIDNDAQERCLENKREFPPPRYAWFYPTRVRAKDIAWVYLKAYAKNIPDARAIESELAIEYPNMGRVTLYGADNSRGVGLYLDGVYYDEDDDIPQKVVTEVAPTLSDYKGFTVHAGMLRGRHNLWKRHEAAKNTPGVFAMMLRASESGIIDDHELSILRREMGDAAYDMQMECNPNAALTNAIYGMEMDLVRRENRLTRLAVDKALPADFFMDIGHAIGGDTWTNWGIQLQNRDIMLQTYFAKTGELPSYYAGQMIEFWDKHNMPQGTVFLPHDGAQKDRHGKTAEDDLREAGIKRIKIVPRTPVLWDSIKHLRALFPRILIDQERCGVETSMGLTPSGEPWIIPSGIDCLDFYTKKEDMSTGIVTDTPVHDQYSHGADGLRTFAEASRLGMVDGMSFTARETRTRPTNVLRGPGPQSYSIGKPGWKGKVLR